MPLPPELLRRRKAQRAELIERRLAASAADRERWSVQIDSWLSLGFKAFEAMTVGFCWPFQGEFDARPFILDLLGHGARAVLPAVIAKDQPLEFREWWPGVAMINGVYDLPVPDRTTVLTPDALLIPALGIGAQGDRLGYGGGFFDRTLAALKTKPIAVALAFELSRIATIEPQPHDVYMDFVVTEAGIQAAVANGLEQLSGEECRSRVALLASQRGLARKDPPRTVRR